MMYPSMVVFVVSLALVQGAAFAAGPFERDRVTTPSGALDIVLIGHGTLLFEYGGKVIHVDPWSELADYTSLPKADIILVTHAHHDHLDPKAIEALRTDKTAVVVAASCAGKVDGAEVMENGDTRTVAGIPIKAVPAYNIVNKRLDGQPYHPKGDGNGYVLDFGGTRVYVAGDTENTPEMAALKNIDIAFLPMNMPYTMTPEMVAAAVKAFQPRILYPYHTSGTDVSALKPLLKDNQQTELRLRKME